MTGAPGLLDESTFVVITSVNRPTEAVRQWAALVPNRLVLVADRRTPVDWTCPGVHLLSIDEQRLAGGALADLLPYNHYSRKMLGYLAAVRAGAAIIVDTDDDNAPLSPYQLPAFEGTFDSTPDDQGFVNMHHVFGAAPTWPRGFPLDLVLDDHRDTPLAPANRRVGIWQGLVDGEPDVDAIWRLTSTQTHAFVPRPPVVLGRQAICPVNSQNTAFARAVFATMYLPTTVTFRFTDILRGLVAQPILWQFGFRVGFTAPSAVQERNPHDAFSDFVSEIPMYQHARRVPGLVDEAISAATTIAEAMVLAYGELARARIVEADEVELLEAWLADLDRSLEVGWHVQG